MPIEGKFFQDGISANTVVEVPLSSDGSVSIPLEELLEHALMKKAEESPVRWRRLQPGVYPLAPKTVQVSSRRTFQVTDEGKGFFQEEVDGITNEVPLSRVGDCVLVVSQEKLWSAIRFVPEEN